MIRLTKGLEKLNLVSDAVAEIQQNLAATVPVYGFIEKEKCSGILKLYRLEHTTVEMEGLMAELTAKRKEAEKTRSSVKIEEEMASNAAAERTRLLKTKLDEVEVLIKAENAKQKDAKNYEEIGNRLKQLLNEFPNESSVYYALGRVSSLSASEAFDETLRDQRLEDAKLHYGNAIRQSNAATEQSVRTPASTLSFPRTSASSNPRLLCGGSAKSCGTRSSRRRGEPNARRATTLGWSSSASV